MEGGFRPWERAASYASQKATRSLLNCHNQQPIRKNTYRLRMRAGEVGTPPRRITATTTITRQAHGVGTRGSIDVRHGHGTDAAGNDKEKMGMWLKTGRRRGIVGEVAPRKTAGAPHCFVVGGTDSARLRLSTEVSPT